MRYDLNVGADIVGVVSVVDEGAGERWLLEIDAFQSQQVSVKFTTEHEALQMAEEWMKAQRQVQRLAATMERSGEGFSVR